MGARNLRCQFCLKTPSCSQAVVNDLFRAGEKIS